MSSMNLTVDGSLFRVRPVFLLICLAFLLALFLPDAIAHRHAAQRATLALASLAILLGWFLLWK